MPIASAFDVYLVGRLLGHSPRSGTRPAGIYLNVLRLDLIQKFSDRWPTDGRDGIGDYLAQKNDGFAEQIDLNFVSGASYIREHGDSIRFGAMTRHAEIEDSSVAARVPIIHDCAAGIADIDRS